MTGPELIDIARDGLMTYARVAGPLMVVILIVGVVISFLQAVTQISRTDAYFRPENGYCGFKSFLSAAFYWRCAFWIYGSFGFANRFRRLK